MSQSTARGAPTIRPPSSCLPSGSSLAHENRRAATPLQLDKSWPYDKRIAATASMYGRSRLFLIFVQIFFGHIVLGQLMGVNFFFIGAIGVFHAHYCVGLEGISFLE